MTSEPANVLIAVVCLAALVLAGGSTQTLVPADGDVRFVIERGGTGIECPENRVIRPCWTPGSNVSQDIWRVEFIQPFLEDTVTVNGTPTPTPTPTPSQSSGGGSATARTTAATATGDDGASATGDGGTLTRTPTTTMTDDRGAAGAGLGRGVDWLLWPLLALIGAVTAVGIGLGLRGESIDGPHDLLAVPGYVRDGLLSVLVGAATRLGSWLRARWQAAMRVVAAAFESTSTAHNRQYGWRVPGAVGVLLGLGRLPAVLLDRLLGDHEVEGGEDASDGEVKAGRSEEPPTGEIDVRRAWAWLAGRTGPNYSGSRTPEDIARDAIDHGFPSEAVNDLLAVFRDVTYGGFQGTGDRLEVARRSYETLREADEPTVDGGD